MLLSSACVYGLRAAVYLSAGSNDSYVSITKISEELDISRHFLTKVLQQLTEAGLLESHKGPRGGVRLTESPGNIFMIEIVAAIDGMKILTECALGLPGCGIEKPCPIHDKWASTRDEIRTMLAETSLDELVQKGRTGNLRLTAEGDFTWE